MALDVTPYLRPERAALIGLLRSLTDDEWAAPTECPAWDVKGLALHIAGDDLSLLTRQRDEATNPLVLYAADHPGLGFTDVLDGFNEQWVRGAAFLSPALVIALLELTGNQSADFYEAVGPATVSGEPVGFFAQHDRPSAYRHVIAREYAERFIHQAQIRRALGRPALDGEVLVGAGEVVTHALAAWVGDLPAPSGAAVVVDLGPAGRRALVPSGNGWTAGPEPGVVSATLTVAVEALVPWLSRGLDAREVRAAVSVAGDEVLGRAVLDRIATPLATPG